MKYEKCCETIVDIWLSISNLQIFVRWIGGGAARVANFRTQHSSRRTVQGVRAPEATHAERSTFKVNVDFMQQWALDFVLSNRKKEKKSNKFRTKIRS